MSILSNVFTSLFNTCRIGYVLDVIVRSSEYAFCIELISIYYKIIGNNISCNAVCVLKSLKFEIVFSFNYSIRDQKYSLGPSTNILLTVRILFFRFNYDPSVQIPAKTFDNPKVSGQNRYKYFRRPIIPFLQQVPPEVLLQPTT